MVITTQHPKGFGAVWTGATTHFLRHKAMSWLGADFGADMLGLGLASQGWENQGGEKVEGGFDKEQGHQGVGEM